MKRALAIAAIALVLPLAGCSSGLLGGKSSVPNAMNVPTSGPLTMPPDLRLPPPGSAAYQPAAPALAPAQPALSTDVYGGVAAVPAAPMDNFARYGISKVKPDGTPKSKDELNAELKAAILAEKRRTNPNYGTIRNIGSIFTDG